MDDSGVGLRAAIVTLIIIVFTIAFATLMLPSIQRINSEFENAHEEGEADGSHGYIYDNLNTAVVLSVIIIVLLALVFLAAKILSTEAGYSTFRTQMFKGGVM